MTPLVSRVEGKAKTWSVTGVEGKIAFLYLVKENLLVKNIFLSSQISELPSLFV
jgi:hypothetical protein